MRLINILFSKNQLRFGELIRARGGSGSREFKEATKRDALNHLQKELENLVATVSAEKKQATITELNGFSTLFKRFLDEPTATINWDKIQKLPSTAVRDYESLEKPHENNDVKAMLEKLVVIKLNGGLGTSMGCHGPKSVIAVRNDLTFLDLTVQQMEHLYNSYQVKVPLVLMNSFNTNEDTGNVIRKYQNLNVDIHTFNQSCYPRINRDTLMPVPKNCDVEGNLEAWYPPGHGDFYQSFFNSNLLKEFIKQGKEYCFISNIDNLGATIDLKILNLLLRKDKEKIEFVMEVTDKTRADVKGGTLIQYEDKLSLLEIAQVPKEHVDDFKSVKTFKFFNTNNLWAKLDAIDRVVQGNKLNLEIIANNKTLANGLNVIQLETAVGAAMKCFEGGIGINVPRSRFLPVKKTSDLMLVMSNLYTLKNGSLMMSPQRMFPTTPLIKLGDNHFAKVREFLNRFANIPDLIELDHLTVSGDVTFGRGVQLKGTVIIIANHGDRIDIPSGAILENKIVSGNMRILDH
ncbi:UTP--glucose-1-phosphate uridylyltransferase isoform X2 [Onthophagus taurus]|uniref:UTP--glucose-1-phosphate uridylyltransferase isoform X2 n=1 Tax=Onthophagus taurus TaxID=166361 RepID=UPI000C209367|nr:UTP--glucose-1-phosphate uridylyltransferase isoform X2 [Onthophagus taurus]